MTRVDTPLDSVDIINDYCRLCKRKGRQLPQAQPQPIARSFNNSATLPHKMSRHSVGKNEGGRGERGREGGRGE